MLGLARLCRFCRRFSRAEDGVVTVDYVVLTAAVVGMGIYSVGLLQTATNNLASAISVTVSATSTSSTP